VRKVEKLASATLEQWGKGVECNFGRTSAISCCPIEGSISFNRVTPPSISFQIPSASHTSPPCPPPTAFQIADAQSETLLAGVELARVLADAEAFDESGAVDDEPTLERTSLLRSRGQAAMASYCECKPPSGMCEIWAPSLMSIFNAI
jgi:hypothetical protein